MSILKASKHDFAGPVSGILDTPFHNRKSEMLIFDDVNSKSMFD